MQILNMRLLTVTHKNGQITFVSSVPTCCNILRASAEVRDENLPTFCKLFCSMRLYPFKNDGSSFSRFLLLIIKKLSNTNAISQYQQGQWTSRNLIRSQITLLYLHSLKRVIFLGAFVIPSRTKSSQPCSPSGSSPLHRGSMEDNIEGSSRNQWLQQFNMASDQAPVPRIAGSW
jgi:hypothetical protein